MDSGGSHDGLAGFRVWGLGFRVSGLGFRVEGLGFKKWWIDCGRIYPNHTLSPLGHAAQPRQKQSLWATKLGP